MLGDAPLLGATQRIARRWSIQGIGMTLGAMIGNMTESRPAVAEDMSGRELLRWYWLRSELATLALSVGVAASGGKQELTARLVAHLDGSTPPPAGPRRLPAPPLLAEPLTAATLIPAGQRCTQQLRRYFIAVIGPSFCFSRVRPSRRGNRIRDVIGRPKNDRCP